MKREVLAPIESHHREERVEQTKGLYKKYIQHTAVIFIEGHSKEEIALTFFGLGFQAADVYATKK